jgi:hypothetical protein
VEAREGYCLLGHPLRLEAPTATLTELRAEVDRAFEAAQAEIDATVVVTEVPGQPAQITAPPPPAMVPASRFQLVWEQLEAAEPASPSDPITAFAPPPRIDWGPTRGPKRMKRPFGRSRATKLA